MSLQNETNRINRTKQQLPPQQQQTNEVGLALVVLAVAATAAIGWWWTSTGQTMFETWRQAGGLDDVIRVAVPVAVLAAVAAAAVGVAVVQGLGRRKVAGRLELAVEAVVGRPERDRQMVRIARWNKRHVAQVVVEYPLRWHPDERRRQELHQVLADKTGVTLDTGVWEPSQDRVTFTTETIEEPWRARQLLELERLELAVVELVGRHEKGSRMVQATRWHEGRPVELVVDYPARWPAGDAGRQMLRLLLAEKTGQDLDGGRWEPVIDRVTFGLRPVEAAKPEPATEKRIETLLGQVRLETSSVKVTGESDDGAPAEVQVAYEPSAKATSDRYQYMVERVVTASLPGRWRGDWDTEHDRVTLRLRPELPTKVPLPVELLGVPGGAVSKHLRIPYALAEDGTWLEWDSSATPHGLVTGPTNGGKTTAIRCLVFGATWQGAEVVICDPKWEFIGMRGHPGVSRVATTAEQIAESITLVDAEMMRRYPLVRKGKLRLSELHPVVLFVDEWMWACYLLNELWAEKRREDRTLKGTTHPAIARARNIVAVGRGCKCQIVEGLQRPDAEHFDSGARDNFGFRMTVGRISPEAARMAWNSYHLGTDIPHGLRGRGVGETKHSVAVEMQVGWTPDPNPALLDELSAEDLEHLDALQPRPDIVPEPTFPAIEDDEDDDLPLVVAAAEVLAPLRETTWDGERGELRDWMPVEQVAGGQRVVIDENGVERVVTVTAADYEGRRDWRISWTDPASGTDGDWVTSIDDQIQVVTALDDALGA